MPLLDFFWVNFAQPDSTATSDWPRPPDAMFVSMARAPWLRLRIAPSWNSICACPLGSIDNMSPSPSRTPWVAV